LKMVQKKNIVTTTSRKMSPEKAKDSGKDSTTIGSTISMYLTHNIFRNLKLDYDVVEYLKKMKANITMFELCKITQLKEQLHKYLQNIQGPYDVSVGNTKEALKGNNGKVNKSTELSSVPNTSSVNDKSKTMVDQNKGDPRVDGALIRKKSRYQTPPFIFTFQIFYHNVHNYLVDSRDSSNVILYSMCKKINVQSQICETKIIQFYKSYVKVMG
jgi:hypothetical protein